MIKELWLKVENVQEYLEEEQRSEWAEILRPWAIVWE